MVEAKYGIMSRLRNFRQAWMELHKLKLPEHVREEIRELQLETAPELARRVMEHTNLKRKVRKQRCEIWNYSSGRYLDPLFWEEFEEGVVNLVELRGVELAMLDQIARVAERKSNDNEGSPVVVVDFGGMHGFSMIRLAAVLTQEVAQGKVVFVVTNLGRNPGYSSLEKNALAHTASWEDLRLFSICRRDIHFVQADAEDLLSSSVSLPSGEYYPLRGHVDILHESMTLTHGKINDIDLPRLGLMLSRYGTLIIGSKFLDPASSVNATDHEVRENAHQLGFLNLERMGLVRVAAEARRSSYTIYQMLEAPSL